MDKMQIENIYKTYITDIYRYSVFKLKNKVSAEDVTAETFARLLEKDDISGVQNLKIYLIGMARNIIYEKYRADKPTLDLQTYEEKTEEVPDSEDIEETTINEELLALIKKEIDKFDDLTREIVTLKVWDNLAFDEIAKIVKQNVNTVKTLYYRGLKSLKTNITKQEKVTKLYSFGIPTMLFYISTLGLAEEFSINTNFLTKLLTSFTHSNLFITLLNMDKPNLLEGAQSVIPSTAAVTKVGLLATTKAKLIAVAASGLVVVGGSGAGIAYIYSNDSETSDQSKTAITCTYEGKEYKDGDNFDDKDKCNTCTCSSDGVVCTDKKCEEEVVLTDYSSTNLALTFSYNNKLGQHSVDYKNEDVIDGTYCRKETITFPNSPIQISAGFGNPTCRGGFGGNFALKESYNITSKDGKTFKINILTGDKGAFQAEVVDLASSGRVFLDVTGRDLEDYAKIKKDVEQILTSLSFDVSEASTTAKLLVDVTGGFYYEEDPFPVIITSLSDANLLTLSCGEVSYLSTIPTDPELQKFYNYKKAELTSQYGKTVAPATMLKCSGNNKTIIMYDYCAESCGGGGGTIAGFGYLNSDGSLSNEVTLKNDGGAYWSCSSPVALRKDGTYVWICGAGDGPRGYKGAYKLDLARQTMTRFYHCYNEPPTGTVETGVQAGKLICQNN